MNCKTAIGVALFTWLLSSPTWVMADSGMRLLPLDTSAAEGSAAHEHLAGSATGSINRLPSVRGDEITAGDCFFAENRYESACQRSRDRADPSD